MTLGKYYYLLVLKYLRTKKYSMFESISKIDVLCVSRRVPDGGAKGATSPTISRVTV